MGPTAQTSSGTVRGQVRDAVTSFLGVPYAASPTGPRRFAAPEPHEPWTGIRDATSFGPTPPKPAYPQPFDTLLAEPDIAGDEWRNLNIWTPDPGASGLPVLIWIHGGAFANGNSAVPWYDGHAFARDGVICVSINYRLGVDGFALLPDAPANRGLLDQVAALEWVRDNIAAFGGDPANVTICGESAGAMSVTTLLAMPRAQGLFAKAIAQSGAAQAAASPADAALITAELGKALSLPATARSLADIPLPDLIAAQAAVRDALGANPDPARFGPSIVAGGLAFVPVVDGSLLPAHPLAAFAAGTGSRTPLLIGTNTEEYRLFLVPTGVAAGINDDLLGFLAERIGAPAKVVDLYRANRPDASAGDVFAALMTDRYFRLPALEVAHARENGPAPTYVYEFAWRHPTIGAGHSIEIPFVFDNLASVDAQFGGGVQWPQDLADQMHATWVRFAQAGEAGWQAWNETCSVRVFDTGGGSIELDPRADERLAWPA